jgi:threonine/homoserine/homoserine lactone efflux protein
MKHHIMIALGILMALLFAFRMANALIEPGLGFRELYLAGGLLIAGYLMYSGWREWRAFKAEKPGSDEA